LAEEPKQERRAFLAIALAMGVLLLWNVLFPMRPGTSPRHGASAPADSTRITALENAPSPSDTASISRATNSPGIADTTRTTVDALVANADTTTVERSVVKVKTPTMELTFDGLGARVTRAALPKFQEPGNGAVEILPHNGPGALGTVLTIHGRRIPLDNEMFRLASDTGGFEGGQRRVVFELKRDSFALRKTFTIPESGNLLAVQHELLREPEGLENWGLSWAGGIRATEDFKGDAPRGYFQASVLAEGKVQKKQPAALGDAVLEFPGQTFFLGIQNKYFLAAVVPQGEHQGPARIWKEEVGERNRKDFAVAGEILVDRTSGVASNDVGYDVYIGPLDFAALTATGLGIEGAIDLGYTWVRPLSQFILKLLIGMHKIVPNYGVVIILFSVLISLLFFPLTFKSTKSMRDMAALKPRLEALKQKHAKDPQKLSEATMKLYKEAGVNPLGGCLPLLLQMPIFFALYAVLFHTIELRGAPFVGWIRDLSQPDILFRLPFSLPIIGSAIGLLPIIMGITSFIQARQTAVDPSQKAMTMMMPVVMTFVFFSFPSGLVLYWLTNNVMMILQRSLMKPSVIPETAAAT
jgi:YidC/Oxa1 family membrane protein insertase